MRLHSLAPLLAALALVSCKEARSVLSASGPFLDGQGEVIDNIILFNYDLSDPEPVHIVAGGKRVETMEIDGKGNWRIELAGGNLTISGDRPIFQTPVAGEGTLASNLRPDDDGQLVFAVTMADEELVRIECPNRSYTGPR